MGMDFDNPPWCPLPTFNTAAPATAMITISPPDRKRQILGKDRMEKNDAGGEAMHSGG